MAGAIAGTTILHLTGPSARLKVVTLTVNNVCNLKCPHCYLQYDALGSFVGEKIIDDLCDADFSHLAIVGKEPLITRDAARRCEDLIFRFVSKHKTVSLITNGHGLHYLHPEILSSLEWIDISFDAGPRTYASYRGACYERLQRNLRWLQNSGYGGVNALHTLSTLNIHHIDDMMAIERDFSFKRIVFSPYLKTFNHGHNSASTASLDQLCRALVESRSFMESPNALFLLDPHEVGAPDPIRLRHDLKTLGLLNKTLIVSNDPLKLGILRVTHDGLVLTPYESLHTMNYLHVGRPLSGASHLNQLYHGLCVTGA